MSKQDQFCVLSRRAAMAWERLFSASIDAHHRVALELSWIENALDAVYGSAGKHQQWLQAAE